MDKRSKNWMLNVSQFSSEIPRKQLLRMTNWEVHPGHICGQERHCNLPQASLWAVSDSPATVKAHCENGFFMDQWETEFW